MYESKEYALRDYSLLGAIYVFDEMLLPVVHLFGLPLKISYILVGAWLFSYFFNINIGKSIIGHVQDLHVKTTLRLLILLVIISCVSEIVLSFFTTVDSRTPFLEGIVFILFFAASFGFGYSCHNINPQVFLYVLYAYIGLNIVFTIFASHIPQSVYNFFIHEVTYADRARGSGGNPNTTLLQMNILLLAIVIFNKKGKLTIKGTNRWLVLLLPLIMNFIVSSRGEFIQTCILELAYIVTLLKKDKSFAKSLFKVTSIIIILLLGYAYVARVLYYQYDDIRIALDRIGALANLTAMDDSAIKETSTLARPFIHFEEFWSRFIHSPLIGCGYSAGCDLDFARSVDRYHNDIFKILASTGVVGLIIWARITRYFSKNAGWIIFLPFVTSAITNTFIQSTHAINLYFFIMGVMSVPLCWEREDT